MNIHTTIFINKYFHEPKNADKKITDVYVELTYYLQKGIQIHFKGK